ncbi:hypothetical protein BC937DRAFT_89008 [Endogone sp. FLAS-F59071]|nr:hypothetical protein BC937DRAFT_89008 [Endogone sp. FLAS-F59071]|eukprot:RUS18234.1 hypothetical protein BC937DRAFT_89008 [Endogone sp. FLAS-F59071]
MYLVPLSVLDLLIHKIAEECFHKQCMSITKFGEGSFHKVYLLNMDDATMQFIAEHTSILLPKVYVWDADPENVVGAEYMLIEKIPGVLVPRVGRHADGAEGGSITPDRRHHDPALQPYFFEIGSLYGTWNTG